MRSRRVRVTAFRILLPIALVAMAIACGRSDLGDELASSGPDVDGSTVDGQVIEGGHEGGRPDSGKDSGGGDGGPCSTASDCHSSDVCSVPFCSSGQCVFKPKDSDNDFFVDSRCGGNDCNDKDPNVHPGAREVCDDGVDNDCNSRTDCQDFSCRNDPWCAADGGGRDGGVRDGGRDSGFDSGDDSGLDSGVDACPGTAEVCNNGTDDDCNGLIDCQDPACGSDLGCTCRGTPESCTNGRDDNCNGLVDCVDPACYANPACNCTGRTPQPEICNDHVDNDCNGKTDCQDSACFANAACSNCHPEICTDTVDNDCNGLIDCADPACAFAPNCAPTQEICDNGKDDDHNGLIDCEDPACKNNQRCDALHEFCNTALPISASGTWTGNTTGFVNRNKGICGGDAGEAVFRLIITQPSKVRLDTIGSQFDSVMYIREGNCGAGRELACDDDTGGNHNALINLPILYPGTYYVFVDGFAVDPRFGPDEGPYVLNVSITQNPPEICDNGLDDDGNHLIDCADPACTNVGRCLNCNGGQPPTPELGVGRCTDGRDNDCDGKADCVDDDCHASKYYTTECCNGRDDNGNGIIDEDACRCASSANCSNGNFCFTHADEFTCNPPCTFIVGDICPDIQPTTRCSQSTRECEYP